MRVLLLCLALTLAACEPSFDRARWASGRGSDPAENPRESMVCAAIAAGVVPGATREQVRALLGPSDSENHAENDIYDVGLEFTSPDEVILSIYYGDTNVAQEVMLHHDWGIEYLRPRVPGSCGGNWTFEVTRN